MSAEDQLLDNDSLGDGFNDLLIDGEQCPKCPKIFPDNQQFMECGCATCPFRMSEMDRRQKFGSPILLSEEGCNDEKKINRSQIDLQL